jgi:3-demethoxyubiquinol 3-hydroxylase
MRNKMKYSLIDHFCLNIDQALRAIFDNPHTTDRTYPATANETILDTERAKHAARLMRINHSGEVCAQALYHGQRIASSSSEIKNTMQTAMIEEGDHLSWCKERLSELQSHTSYLNPIWYAGSFSIGLLAGLLGDRWSLGFLAETEQQVIKHLEQHISLLENHDSRSTAILKQMQDDEARHRDHAIEAGGHPLPGVIKKIMAFTSKIMVKTTYWI